MRFVLIILAVAAAALIGLWIYGEILQPETRQIEQEAVSPGDA